MLENGFGPVHARFMRTNGLHNRPSIIGYVICVCCGALAVTFQTEGQTYDTNNDIVQTFAGSAFSGYLDGVGQQTMFNGPSAVVADSSNNLFVLDVGNGRIRKITTNAMVSTFAGGGTQTSGYGTNANLTYDGTPWAMTIDHSNALWITTQGGLLLRIGSDGYVSYSSLSGTSATGGIAVDSGNNVYISDTAAEKIWRYRTNGVLEVFAGSGNAGYTDGNGVFSSFSAPKALAVDAADNIYVWDSGSRLIRRIDQSRNVVTLAGNRGVFTDLDGFGTNASFNETIGGMCVDDSGNLILACGGTFQSSSVRKITPTTNVVTMAGSFTQNGYTNGAGNLAAFNGASGVWVSQGVIFVADSGNQRIRQIAFNSQAAPVSGADLGIGTYSGLTITGMVGRTYQIQTSPDLNSWNTVATLLLTSSPYLWIDKSAVAGNKFYRALLLP